MNILIFFHYDSKKSQAMEGQVFVKATHVYGSAFFNILTNTIRYLQNKGEMGCEDGSIVKGKGAMHFGGIQIQGDGAAAGAFHTLTEDRLSQMVDSGPMNKFTIEVEGNHADAEMVVNQIPSRLSQEEAAKRYMKGVQKAYHAQKKFLEKLQSKEDKMPLPAKTANSGIERKRSNSIEGDYNIIAKGDGIVINQTINGAGEQSMSTAEARALINKDLPTFIEEVAQCNQQKPYAEHALNVNAVSLADCYADLVCLSKEKHRNIGTARRKKQSLLAYHEISNHKGRVCSYQDLLPSERCFAANAPKKKILVTGMAGVGKTTLSRKVAQECKNIVCLHIPIRKLSEASYSEKSGPHTLAKVVFKECSSSLSRKHWDEALWSAFLEVLITRECDNKAFIEFFGKWDIADLPFVCIVLDGYDERHVPPHLVSVFETLCSAHYLVLTSRSYNLDGLGQAFFANHFEVTGFSTQMMNRYIDGFFYNLKLGDEETRREWAESLKAYLADSPHIAGSCRIPINCKMTCTAWASGDLRKDVHTMSGMYSALLRARVRDYVIDAKNRGAQNKNSDDVADKRKLCCDDIAFVEYFAFLSLMDRSLFLSPDETIDYLNQFPPGKENRMAAQKLFGFIKPYVADEGMDEAMDLYYFSHLTLRDFFAARYLANALQLESGSCVGRAGKKKRISIHIGEAFYRRYFKDNETTVRAFLLSRKFDASFEYVLWFMAGLLSGHRGRNHACDVQSLTYFYECLLSDSVKNRSQSLILVRCLDESRAVLDQLDNALKARLFAQVHWGLSVTIRFHTPYVSCTIDDEGSYVHGYSQNIKASRTLLNTPDVLAFFKDEIEKSNDDSFFGICNFFVSIDYFPLGLLQTFFEGMTKKNISIRLINAVVALLLRHPTGWQALQEIACLKDALHIKHRMHLSACFELLLKSFRNIWHAVFHQTIEEDLAKTVQWVYDQKTPALKMALARLTDLSKQLGGEQVDGVQAHLINGWSRALRFSSVLNGKLIEKKTQEVKHWLAVWSRSSEVEIGLAKLAHLFDAPYSKTHLYLIRAWCKVLRFPTIIGEIGSAKSLLEAWSESLFVARALVQLERFAEHQNTEVQGELVNAWYQVLRFPGVLAKRHEVEVLLAAWSQSSWVEKGLLQLERSGHVKDPKVHKQLISAWGGLLVLPVGLSEQLAKGTLAQIKVLLAAWFRYPLVEKGLIELERFGDAAQADVQATLVSAWARILILPYALKEKLADGSVDEAKQLLEIWSKSVWVDKGLAQFERLMDGQNPLVQSKIIDAWSGMLALPGILTRKIARKNLINTEQLLEAWIDSPLVAKGLAQLERLGGSQDPYIQCMLARRWSALLVLPHVTMKRFTKGSITEVKGLLKVWYGSSLVERGLVQLEHLSGGHDPSVQRELGMLWCDMLQVPYALMGKLAKGGAIEVKVCLKEWYGASLIERGLVQLHRLLHSQDVEVQRDLASAWAHVFTLPGALVENASCRTVAEVRALLTAWQDAQPLLTQFGRLCASKDPEVQANLVSAWYSILYFPDALEKQLAKGSVEDAKSLLMAWYGTSWFSEISAHLVSLGAVQHAVVQSHLVKAWYGILYFPCILEVQLAKGSVAEVQAWLDVWYGTSWFDKGLQQLGAMTAVQDPEVSATWMQSWHDTLSLPAALRERMMVATLTEVKAWLDIWYGASWFAKGLLQLEHWMQRQDPLLQRDVMHVWYRLLCLPDVCSKQLSGSWYAAVMTQTVAAILERLGSASTEIYKRAIYDCVACLQGCDLMPDTERESILTFCLNLFKRLLDHGFQLDDGEPKEAQRVWFFLLGYVFDRLDNAYLIKAIKMFESTQITASMMDDDPSHTLHFERVFDRLGADLQAPLIGGLPVLLMAKAAIKDLLAYALRAPSTHVRHSVLMEVFKRLDDKGQSLRFEGDDCLYIENEKTVKLPLGSVPIALLQKDVQTIRQRLNLDFSNQPSIKGVTKAPSHLWPTVCWVGVAVLACAAPIVSLFFMPVISFELMLVMRFISGACASLTLSFWFPSLAGGHKGYFSAGISLLATVAGYVGILSPGLSMGFLTGLFGSSLVHGLRATRANQLSVPVTESQLPEVAQQSTTSSPPSLTM